MGSTSEGGLATVMTAVPSQLLPSHGLKFQILKNLFSKELSSYHVSEKPTSISIHERSQENKYKRKPNDVIKFWVSAVGG